MRNSPARVHGEARHGQRTREYHAWRQMKRRCYSKNVAEFKNYGGRGIVVCDLWRNDYLAFKRDMGLCPTGYSLDRINNEGPYSPENCRWASREQQMRNTRNNVYFTYLGKTQTMAEWAIELKISYDCLRRRRDLGWPVDKLLSVKSGEVHRLPLGE